MSFFHQAEMRGGPIDERIIQVWAEITKVYQDDDGNWRLLTDHPSEQPAIFGKSHYVRAPKYDHEPADAPVPFLWSAAPPPTEERNG